MKAEIINWLKYDRTFFIGMLLYARYGHSLSLKAVLNRQGETEYNMQLLQEELAKLAGLSPHELKAITEVPVYNYKQAETQKIKPKTTEEKSIVVEEPGSTEENPADGEILENTEADTGEGFTKPEPETKQIVLSELPQSVVKAIRLREEFPFLSSKDCPKELKILVSDMLTAYDSYRTAHESLFTAETEAELLEASKQAVENYLENRLIWAELNHFKEKAEILGEHPLFDELKTFAELSALTAAELSKKKGNIASQITRLNKAIEDPKDPDKVHLYTEKLASAKRVQAEIERLLSIR